MTKKSEENLEEKDEKILKLPGHSGTKPVYLVTVQDKKNNRFVSYKLHQDTHVLKVQGWMVKQSNSEINNLKDAEDQVNRDTYYDIQFPWHRVISIRNLTFKR